MDLERRYTGIVWVIVWDRKAIDIGEGSICEGGQLERFYCIYVQSIKSKP